MNIFYFFFFGIFFQLNERIVDLSLGSFRCTLTRSTVLSPSITFYQTIQVFTVLALSRPWSSLEIIAYPFQLHIWIILMFLVIFLLSASLILKSYRPNILKFIFGFKSVNLINMNIIATILNQNVVVLPQRNFARYCFLMWILLVMNLRSIYQGSLYDFLKSQQYIAPPDSSEDLIQRQYELIVNIATIDSFSGLQIVRDNLLKVIIVNTTDYGGFPLLEANPNKYYVTGTPKDFLSYYAKTNGKQGVFHILKESVFNQQLCIYFTKHSYLVKIFNNFLYNLQYFGLIDHWAHQLLDSHFLKETKEEPTKKPLTLTQLLGIVNMCLVLYFIAFLIFIIEIFWFKLKKINK